MFPETPFGPDPSNLLQPPQTTLFLKKMFSIFGDFTTDLIPGRITNNPDSSFEVTTV